MLFPVPVAAGGGGGQNEWRAQGGTCKQRAAALRTVQAAPRQTVACGAAACASPAPIIPAVPMQVSAASPFTRCAAWWAASSTAPCRHEGWRPVGTGGRSSALCVCCDWRRRRSHRPPTRPHVRVPSPPLQAVQSTEPAYEWGALHAFRPLPDTLDALPILAFGFQVCTRFAFPLELSSCWRAPHYCRTPRSPSCARSTPSIPAAQSAVPHQPGGCVC